jgi:hypothetical protein
MPTINWLTKVISVPQSELTLLSGTKYELNVNTLRLALKDIEDGEEGMPFPDTHRHATESTLSGVTYARQFEIINGYTVSFQNTGTPYSIAFVGANHNIADVTNYDGGASLVIGNSAGLQVVATGSGVLPSDITAIAAAVATILSEGGETWVETLRLIRAATAGKQLRPTESTVVLYGKDGTTQRIAANVNANGERTTVVTDAS